MSVRGPAASAVIAVLLGACSGAAAPSPSPTAAATASAAPATASPSAAGPWTFTVDASSKATIRVREVLASVRAPGDAVLTVTGFRGAFTLRPDGSFTPESKITADMTTIASDQSRRDAFVRDNTLDTRRFPTAELVPTKVSGLTLPLAMGASTFTLTGRMTLRGVTKDVVFTVRADRAGGRLTAVAAADPAWTFADFGMTVPRVASVLSIDDEIRVEVTLVATEGAR